MIPLIVDAQCRDLFFSYFCSIFKHLPALFKKTGSLDAPGLMHGAIASRTPLCTPLSTSVEFCQTLTRLCIRCKSCFRFCHMSSLYTELGHSFHCRRFLECLWQRYVVSWMDLHSAVYPISICKLSHWTQSHADCFDQVRRHRDDGI